MRYRTASTAFKAERRVGPRHGGVRGRSFRLPFIGRRARSLEGSVSRRHVRRPCLAERLAFPGGLGFGNAGGNPSLLNALHFGQSSVEAAFLIPSVFIMLLLLLQPGIVLYDRTVMAGAAAEGCRLLATRTDAAGAGEDAYREAVLGRLGSIPPEPHFHVHDGGCTWEIDLSGSECDPEVAVRIENKLEPLPIVGAAAGLFGALDEDGLLTVEVTAVASTQADWVAESELGLDPRSWVEKWK